jgi:1-deoxy-D-xylulose-5-phosphate synthase
VAAHPEPLPIGRGELLRPGDDVTLLGIGRTVAVALRAAELLEARGVQACVVDARFVKPLDEALIGAAARRSLFVVTLEDHVLPGGFGSAVLEWLSREVPLCQARLLGIADAFVEHADQRDQWRAARIDPESVAADVERWLAKLGRPAPPRASSRVELAHAS